MIRKHTLIVCSFICGSLVLMMVWRHWAVTSPVRQNGQPPRLAVSWMTSWATTGQIMTALTHTNIPQLYGSNATFPHFLFGPDMNEAAITGNVDATNTGVVPTVNLLAASDDWVIVCRLIYFPVSLIVPKDSPIGQIRDLSGRSVGVPFGGGSHPYVLQRLEEFGLIAGEGPENVRLINLKPPEQPLAFRQGSVDSIATWEPQTAIALGMDGKTIDQDVHVGFLAVRKSLAERYPTAIVRLLKAYIEAHFFVAQQRALTDEWFAHISQFDSGLLDRLEVIEPNVAATSIEDIDISLSDADVARTQRIADVMHKHGLTPRRVDVAARVDRSYLKTAVNELRENGYETDAVRVANQ